MISGRKYEKSSGQHVITLKIVYGLSLTMIFLLYRPATGLCQFYPRPVPVHLGSEKELEENLRKVQTGSADLNTLLWLANVYLYKPRKSQEYLLKSIDFASKAKKLAITVRDSTGFNEACQLVADAQIQNERIEDAEHILSEVHGQTRIDLLFTLSYCYAIRQGGDDRDNLRKATDYVNEGAALADLHSEWKSRNTALRIKGVIHTEQGNYPLAEKELMAALNESRRRGDAAVQYNLMDLIRLYFAKGDYNKALSAALNAVQQTNSSQDSLGAGDAHFMLAAVFGNTGQFLKAEDNCKQALQYYLKFQGLYSATQAIKAVGQTLISQKKYQEALRFYQTYFRKYTALTFEDRRAETGSLGDCYLKLKKYNIAEQYFVEEFNAAKKEKALSEFSYHRMGYFYIETRNYKKAQPYLLNALNYEYQSSLQSKGHLYYMLFLADSASGDYASAIHFLRKNKEVDEELHQQTKVKEVQALVAGYEANKRNQEIKLLKRNDQLQQANVKNAEFVKNVAIGGIAVLMLGGLVFYRQNLKKLRMSALVNQKNKQLEVLLNEKEWFLKETHHRVKNNLQTVVSLLQIQSEFLKDDALAAVENSQHRIYAMSLIHQKLYLTEDTKHINLAIYVRELVDYLKDSFGNGSEVTYLVEVAPLKVDISHAITLGLIINEAVLNSVKHAFSQKKNCMIKVVLAGDGDNIILKVSDNGIGFTRLKAAPEKKDSMGIQLIEGLCRDIDALVSFENKNGTTITVAFPIIKSDKTLI